MLAKPTSLMALVFFAFLFFFGVKNVSSLKDTVKDVFEGETETVKEVIRGIEDGYNETFYKRLRFIDLHGGFQRVLGKQEVGNFDVVRDLQGNIHHTYNSPGRSVIDAQHSRDPEDYRYIQTLQKYCDEQGLPLVMTITPHKVQQGYTTFPTGISSYKNENLDFRRDMMRQMGATVLDLRESMERVNYPKENAFYKTDHHWTTETSFWAFGEILNFLEQEYALVFPNKEQITNIENYNRRVYEQFFLGSTGRRVGRYYAKSGLDDYTLLWPKFDTWMRLEDPKRSEAPIEGTFYETMIDQTRLRDDPTLQVNRYGTYLSTDRQTREIYNPDGTGKLLILHDSFGLGISPFLALAFEETTIFDMRYHDESLLEYLQMNSDRKYDAILVVNQHGKGDMVGK